MGANALSEAALRFRLVANNAATWSAAVSGDPTARLLHSPWRESPYPIYERLRSSGPLVRSKLGLVTATTHETCRAVLRDRSMGVRPESGPDPLGELDELDLSLLKLDPPDHTRLRKLAAPAFRARRLAALRESVESIAHDLVDRATRRGEFDLMRDVALPLPIRVITALLDLRDVDTPTLARHGSALASSLDGVRGPRQLRAVRRADAAFHAMFTDLMEQRRRAPGDDVVSDLVHAHDDEQVTADELVALCRLLLVAGFETTVNLIGNGTLALLRHPEQWAALRDDPGLAPSAVEEVLRWDGPVQSSARIAHETVEIGGRRLRKGTLVLVLLGSAGRDPAAHSDPDRFDITREESEHLAFSHGAHYCLGAPLARMEGDLAFRVLADWLPNLTLAGRPRQRRTTVLRGLRTLPVASGAVPAPRA
ncbi:cytochrome P450 [Allosaccharopolyspora coralli]|uniref:Cytochrome P450 n=1 Tax=Allosaccharopolyspora coralli TaxID=2665642 RepID=A0A5Q3QLR9_9PSEU|nr:cytochrome P450 [Allosaccharopolyspora coralli]